MVRDTIGHRAEHAPRASHASVADDDHLGYLLVSDSRHRVCGLPEPNASLARNTDPSESTLRSVDVVPAVARLAAGRLVADGVRHT
jgi:hypothetical protein